MHTLNPLSLLCACLFVLLLAPSCSGQACVSACDAGLTTCGSIPYNLYITNTTNVLANEFAVTKFQYESYQMLNFILYFPEVFMCSMFLRTFMCNALHTSCDANSTIPTPVPMCYGQCVALNQTCGAVYKYLPAYVQAYFNCDGLGPHGPLYTKEGSCSSLVTQPVSTSGCPNNTLLTPLATYYTGVCTKFDAKEAPNLYEYCAPFISEYIYIPMNWTKTLEWYDDFCVHYLAVVHNFYPVTPQKCHKHIMALACRSVMPPCVSEFVPFYQVNSGVPTISCDSFCELANENCEGFYEKTDSSTYYVQNCSVYPKDNYTLYLSPFQPVTVNCSTFMYPKDALINYTVPDATCPVQTGKKKIHSDEDSYCDLRCPDSSYSLGEWKKLSRLTIAGASFSLIAMAFLIFSYLLQYERRSFPSTIHFWEFVATAMFAISFLIGGSEPEKTTWCYDAGTNATQENNTRCGVQGFFFIFFGLALTTWCFVIAFIMFYAIVLNNKIPAMARYSPLMHLFAWGVPLAFSIGALATKSIGYGPPLAWCFIHFDGFGFSSGGLSKDYTFFYIPIAVLFVSILFMFVGTVLKIIHVRHGNLASASVARKGSRTFQAQIRVLIFIFIIFVICFTIFEWRLQIRGNSTLAAVGLEWVYCKIKGELNIPTTAICTGDTSPARVDYRHTAFESFLLSGIGILIFIGFGTDPYIYRHWYIIGKLTAAGDWDRLVQLVKFGKDPFPPSKSPTNSTGKTRSKESLTPSGGGTSNGTLSSSNTSEKSMEEPDDSINSNNSIEFTGAHSKGKEIFVEHI